MAGSQTRSEWKYALAAYAGGALVIMLIPFKKPLMEAMLWLALRNHPMVILLKTEAVMIYGLPNLILTGRSNGHIHMVVANQKWLKKLFKSVVATCWQVIQAQAITI